MADPHPWRGSDIAIAWKNLGKAQHLFALLQLVRAQRIESAQSKSLNSARSHAIQFNEGLLKLNFTFHKVTRLACCWGERSSSDRISESWKGVNWMTSLLAWSVSWRHHDIHRIHAKEEHDSRYTFEYRQDRICRIDHTPCNSLEPQQSNGQQADVKWYHGQRGALSGFIKPVFNIALQDQLGDELLHVASMMPYKCQVCVWHNDKRQINGSQCMLFVKAKKHSAADSRNTWTRSMPSASL